MNNPFALLQVWAQILNGQQQRRSTKDQIAVVYIEGGISLGNPDSSPFSLAGSGGAYSEPLRKALQQQRTIRRSRRSCCVSTPRGARPQPVT